MQVEEMTIPGVKLINGKIIEDLRGSFFKPYTYNEILKLVPQFEAKEVFYSISKNNVIRGMHFQKPPSAQAKIVTVIKGKITDVLLDLRIDSKHYGKFISIDLDQNDGKSIFIPRGVAHGFLGKELENIVLYLTDSEYSKENEDGIRYDSFGYNWGTTNPVFSERDASFMKFENFNSPFGNLQW